MKLVSMPSCGSDASEGIWVIAHTVEAHLTATDPAFQELGPHFCSLYAQRRNKEYADFRSFQQLFASHNYGGLASIHLCVVGIGDRQALLLDALLLLDYCPVSTRLAGTWGAAILWPIGLHVGRVGAKQGEHKGLYTFRVLISYASLALFSQVSPHVHGRHNHYSGGCTWTLQSAQMLGLALGRPVHISTSTAPCFCEYHWARRL